MVNFSTPFWIRHNRFLLVLISVHFFVLVFGLFGVYYVTNSLASNILRIAVFSPFYLLSVKISIACGAVSIGSIILNRLMYKQTPSTLYYYSTTFVFFNAVLLLVTGIVSYMYWEVDALPLQAMWYVTQFIASISSTFSIIHLAYLDYKSIVVGREWLWSWGFASVLAALALTIIFNVESQFYLLACSAYGILPVMLIDIFFCCKWIEYLMRKLVISPFISLWRSHFHGQLLTATTADISGTNDSNKHVSMETYADLDAGKVIHGSNNINDDGVNMDQVNLVHATETFLEDNNNNDNELKSHANENYEHRNNYSSNRPAIENYKLADGTRVSIEPRKFSSFPIRDIWSVLHADYRWDYLVAISLLVMALTSSSAIRSISRVFYSRSHLTQDSGVLMGLQRLGDSVWVTLYSVWVLLICPWVMNESIYNIYEEAKDAVPMSNGDDDLPWEQCDGSPGLYPWSLWSRFIRGTPRNINSNNNNNQYANMNRLRHRHIQVHHNEHGGVAHASVNGSGDSGEVTRHQTAINLENAGRIERSKRRIAISNRVLSEVAAKVSRHEDIYPPNIAEQLCRIPVETQPRLNDHGNNNYIKLNCSDNNNDNNNNNNNTLMNASIGHLSDNRSESGQSDGNVSMEPCCGHAQCMVRRMLSRNYGGVCFIDLSGEFQVDSESFDFSVEQLDKVQFDAEKVIDNVQGKLEIDGDHQSGHVCDNNSASEF